ncbi:MAG: hypothetical protein M3044_04260 [Thermoproteota archaeon]|nr:hypothetical protein [Thermoproteota archaeon]
MTIPIHQDENSSPITRCFHCTSPRTYLDKTKWGVRPHNRYDSYGRPICGRCYARANWKERLNPIVVACDGCKATETTNTKYGTPRWAKNRDREGGYLCWSCYITKINTGRILSPNGRKNLSAGIRRALDAGAIMGPKIHTMDETVFDSITEPSAYWIGDLMADGNINTGKTGNPRISLTIAARDHEHLVKFRKFLNCSNPILIKISKVEGKIWKQYTLRFSSKRIAENLIGYGVTAKKSLTAKVIGLQDNKHFWRGVLDGDGHIKNRDGKDGDRVVVSGSHDLMYQFMTFIENNIPNARTRLIADRKIYRLILYSYTARKILCLLYENCVVALDRKLEQARRMIEGSKD